VCVVTHFFRKNGEFEAKGGRGSEWGCVKHSIPEYRAACGLGWTSGVSGREWKERRASEVTARRIAPIG
jgi:hypothetical protein